VVLQINAVTVDDTSITGVTLVNARILLSPARLTPLHGSCA
jgi:hypothetical protein